MILNLILQDSNLYKNLTILSYEASTSTAKEGNYIEVQVAHLRKPVRVLKIIGLLGDDEQGKDELILQMSQVNLYLEHITNYFESIESFNYVLNYLKFHSDTNLIHQHTVEIVKTDKKAYVKHYYKDVNKKKVEVFNRKYDRDGNYWDYVDNYDDEDYQRIYKLMNNTGLFVFGDDWYNSYEFRLHNLKLEHKPFILEFISDILNLKVVDITKDVMYNVTFIHYLTENNQIKKIQFNDLHYSKHFAISFIISLFTTSNTLFIIHRYFDVIHPHLGQYLLNKVRNQEFYNNNQVLFNTNNAELIDTQYMRADQIYFVESNPENTINLFSAQDFEGIRENVPFDKWYLAGKFGAIPDILEVNY